MKERVVKERVVKERVVKERVVKERVVKERVVKERVETGSTLTKQKYALNVIAFTYIQRGTPQPWSDFVVSPFASYESPWLSCTQLLILHIIQV